MCWRISWEANGLILKLLKHNETSTGMYKEIL